VQDRDQGPGQNVAEGTPTCPAWAVPLIREIRALEVRLGNIIDEQRDVHEVDLLRLAARVGDEMGDREPDEALVEQLFADVARRLANEGHSFAAIAAFVNEHMRSGRLPYCNAQEVRDAVAH
jgi:hypothetical protein